MFINYPEAFSTMPGLHLFYIYYRSRPGVYNLPRSLQYYARITIILYIYITGPGLVFIIYPEAFSTMPGLHLFYIYYRSRTGVYNLPRSLQYYAGITIILYIYYRSRTGVYNLPRSLQYYARITFILYILQVQDWCLLFTQKPSVLCRDYNYFIYILQVQDWCL